MTPEGELLVGVGRLLGELTIDQSLCVSVRSALCGDDPGAAMLKMASNMPTEQRATADMVRGAKMPVLSEECCRIVISRLPGLAAASPSGFGGAHFLLTQGKAVPDFDFTRVNPESFRGTRF